MAWTSASHAQEVQRLTTLLAHYEEQNGHQRRQLEDAAETKEAHIERIRLLEQEKAALTKKLRSVEVAFKFEKVASDGSRKKLHTMEIDVLDLRAKSANLQTELDMVSKREKALLLTLQQERISRLQLLHEKESLLRANELIQRTLALTEADNTDAHQRLLGHLQRLESLMEQTGVQERLLAAQSQEIVVLNGELMETKDKSRALACTLGDQAATHASFQHVIDFMQQEVSRVRKELSDASVSASARSHSLPGPAHANNALVDKVNQLTASRFNDSSFTTDHVFSTRSSGALPPSPMHSSSSSKQRAVSQATHLAREQAAECVAGMPLPGSGGHAEGRWSAVTSAAAVTPLTSAQRPRSTADQHVPPTGSLAHFNSPERVEMLSWIRSSGTIQSRGGRSRSDLCTSSAAEDLGTSKLSLSSTFLLPSLAFNNSTADDSSATPTTALSASVKRRRKAAPNLGKSLFIGQGLALKHNAQLDADLRDLQAGSTKQILQRILKP